MKKDVKIFHLKDLVDLHAGYAFRGAIKEVPDGDVHVLQIKDVSPEAAINWRHVLRTALSSPKTPDWLQADDLLLMVRGSRFYAACLDAPPGKSVCSPHFFHLRVKSGVGIIPSFLTWQINQPPFQRQLQNAAEGSSQLSIRRSALESMAVCLPDLQTQQSIAALNDLARRERQVLYGLVRAREQQLAGLAETMATRTFTTQSH